MKKISTLLTLFWALSAFMMAQTNDYPFTITKEGEVPTLYYIYSGRDGGGNKSNYVFTNITPWGATKPKLCLNNQDPRLPLNQFWYFMEAEDGNIIIISAEDGMMVTVAGTNDAPKCIEMQSKEELTNKYYTWILDKTNGCYAFKTADKKTFLSHNGNWQSGGQQMGLYNANGSRDEGSRVFFELAPHGVGTGIKAVKANIEHSEIYTIKGQKVNDIKYSGLYIVKGKKILVK